MKKFNAQRFIVNCGLDQLDQVIKKYAPARIISTLPEDQAPVTPSYMDKACHLKLTFNDISRPIDGLSAVENTHIEQLLAFTNNWTEEAPLLIHCWMGISRSTATALTLCNYLHPEISEKDWAMHLRKQAPSATPNPRIIALADSALNRKGRLIDSATFIGRGRDASSGKYFIMTKP